MTYPIRNAVDLDLELDKIYDRANWETIGVEVELRDGTRWQVDGVKTDMDGETVKAFVLCVGPKEEK